MKKKREQQQPLTLAGIPKLQAEWMERRFDSPLAIYARPFTRDSWRKTRSILRRQERKCQIGALQDRIRGARIMADKMPSGASPWDAMKSMWEIEQSVKAPAVDGLARRFMREACYTVMNEFADRKVSV